MSMLMRHGWWSLCAVTAGTAAASSPAAQNAPSGWMRVWTTVFILVTMAYVMRRQILGRVISVAATIAASKTVQFIKIEKVILKPLQVFNVEVVTRDGWRIHVSRVELDVRLKTFLSSFGQMKLVWVVVDSLSVTPPSTAAANPLDKVSPDATSPTTTTDSSDPRKPVTAVMGVLKFTELQIKSISCTVSVPLVLDGSTVVLAVQCTGKDLELAVSDFSASTGIMTTEFSHSSSSCLVQAVPTGTLVHDDLFADPSTSTSVHFNDVRLIVKAHYLTKLLHEVLLVGTGSSPSAAAFIRGKVIDLVQKLQRTTRRQDDNGPRPLKPAFVHDVLQLGLQTLPVAVHVVVPSTSVQLSWTSYIDSVRITAVDEIAAHLSVKTTSVHFSDPAAATAVPWVDASSIECHISQLKNAASDSDGIVATVTSTVASIAVHVTPAIHEYVRAVQAMNPSSTAPATQFPLTHPRRHIALNMQSHEVAFTMEGHTANAKCVVAFAGLVLESPDAGNVFVTFDQATAHVAADGDGGTAVTSDMTVKKSSGKWAQLPRPQGQVELESLEWSLQSTPKDSPTRSDPDDTCPRLRLTDCRLHVTDSSDCKSIAVHISDAIAHWNHTHHMDTVVAIHSLASVCQRLGQLPRSTTATTPPPSLDKAKTPLDLSIKSNAFALHLRDMAHLPANSHLFAVHDLVYHLVETGRDKVTTVHTGVGVVAPSGSADNLIEVSSVGMHMTHSEATGGDEAKLDVHDLTLNIPNHYKLMVFVKQVQQIFVTSVDQGKRSKPPLDLTAHVTNIATTLALPDDRNGVKLKLTGRCIDVKCRIAHSMELSEALEATLQDTDTCFRVADYRLHVSRISSFTLDVAAQDVHLLAFSAVQNVFSVNLDALSVAGDIHEVALSPAAVGIPPSRLCLGVRIDANRPTLHVDKVFVALEVVPVVVASLDELTNTSILDKDYVRVNPRHKTFGSVEVAVTNTSWTASLTSENQLSGRLSRLRLAMDKTNRLDCHVADLSVELSGARLLHLSQVQWAVQFVHQGSAAGVDVWHAVVSGAITSHDKTPTVMENKLSLEWTTLVAVGKKFLTEQLLPPRVERHGTTQGFNTLHEVTVTLALRPIQIGWSEANTPTLIHFEMNHVDVSFGATKDPTGTQWLPQSFAVDTKSLQGFILEGVDQTTRPNSFVVQAARVHAVNASMQTSKHVPIQVDKLKLLWTVAIRDHIFHMVDIVHDDVVQLLEIVRGNRVVLSSPKALAPLVHQKSSPTSLLDLLHQGKLGYSDDANSTSREKKPDSSKQAFSNHFPTGLVLTKQYSIALAETQIHVAEPDSKSSMVVASRHIQIELGKDQLAAYTMADIALTDMTCHVAPLDVDIGAGVLWYNPQPRTTGAPSLLQPIMKECSITCKYNMALANQATFVQVDMPSLIVGMDSNQFFQCFSVVRHVLLAPPKVPKPKPNVAPLTMDKNVKRKKLQAAIAEELRVAGLRSVPSGSPSTALKCVAFRVGQAQCRFRTGPEDGGAEFVAIGMDEAEGSHVYYDDSCIKFGINMQWLEIQNLKPGSSSMCFDDPMSVVKPRLEEGSGQQIKTMLSIRAESKPLPPSQFQPGVRVFDMLEASIFPGIPYDIAIQLAVDFYELMFKFFFGNHVKTPMTAHEIKMHMSNPMAKFGMKELLTRPPSLPTEAAASADDLLAEDDDEIAESAGAELFYFNYVRIGNICLNISCLGFVVNLNGFELELPHFVCQGKLCTWKQLLRKFEGHLAWHVTKESASSGLNHVKKKFMTFNKPFKRKDKPATPANKKDSAENMATLFGPYHQHE